MRKKLVSSARCAIKMRSREADTKKALASLKADLRNGPQHCFGCHERCSPDFCKTAKQRLVSTSTPSSFMSSTPSSSMSSTPPHLCLTPPRLCPQPPPRLCPQPPPHLCLTPPCLCPQPPPRLCLTPPRLCPPQVI